MNVTKTFRAACWAKTLRKNTSLNQPEDCNDDKNNVSDFGTPKNDSVTHNHGCESAEDENESTSETSTSVAQSEPRAKDDCSRISARESKKARKIHRLVTKCSQSLQEIFQKVSQ